MAGNSLGELSVPAHISGPLIISAIHPIPQQLPPVSKEGLPRKKHCFQASVWSQCVPNTIELKRVYRQQDPVFIRLLRMVSWECPFFPRAIAIVHLAFLDLRLGFLWTRAVSPS